MTGRLGESGLGDQGVYDVLDLCLECRACKAECPVGVDVARFKSEFLADYWARHGTPLHARVLGGAHELAQWGSYVPRFANFSSNLAAVKALNERIFGIDRRRSLPQWSTRTLTQIASGPSAAEADVLLFNDTFTNYYNPEIGMAAMDVLRAGGIQIALAGNACCGRPLISKGLLDEAKHRASENVAKLYGDAQSGKRFVFCEPSCLSAMREDLPSLLRGEEQRKAETIARNCMSFEEFVESELAAGRLRLNFTEAPGPILLHGHCHQKSMGLLPPAKALLARIPKANIIDPDAGCCGMAGSFGYSRDHYEVSQQIGERRLLPAVRNSPPGTSIVAAGFSCRHQISDFTNAKAMHPAVFLQSRLAGRA